MNWVLIIVLAVLAFCAIRGYQRGFLRIVYSLVSWIIVFVLVAWLTPYVNDFLTRNTPIYEKVEQHCEEMLRESAKTRANEGLEEERSEFSQLGIEIPESVVDSIMEKAAGTADHFLEASGIYTEMAKGLASFVTQGISFLITLICVSVMMHLISNILGIISRIPVIKGVNRFCGIFAGGIYGLVLVWVAFCVVALCSTSELGGIVISYIHQSGFLTALYENNGILTIMLHCMA